MFLVLIMAGAKADEKFKKLQAYVEMVIDSKLEDWRVTRRDLRAILERLNELRTQGNSLLQRLSEIINNQDSIKGLLGEMRSDVKQRSELIVSRIDMSAKNIIDSYANLRSLTMSIQTQNKEISERLEEFFSTFKTFRDVSEKTLKGILGYQKEAMASLGKLKEMITQLGSEHNDLQSTVGNIMNSIPKILEKQRETDNKLDKISISISQISSGVEKLTGDVNQKFESIRNTIKHSSEENLRRTQELIDSLTSRISNLASRIETVSKKQERILEIMGVMDRHQKTQEETFKEISSEIKDIAKNFTLLKQIFEYVESLSRKIETLSEELSKIKAMLEKLMGEEKDST